MWIKNNNIIEKSNSYLIIVGICYHCFLGSRQIWEPIFYLLWHMHPVQTHTTVYLIWAGRYTMTE